MDIMTKQQCFATIKDHKDNFRVNPKYRLLNPTKSGFGKIRKCILQQISTNIRTALNVNQWKNSSEVIKWFKNIKNKNLHTFTVFHIQKFYPSIREKLLKYPVLFAQTHTKINRKDIEAIFIAVDHYCFMITSHELKKIAMVASMSLWEVTTEQKCVTWLGCLC